MFFFFQAEDGIRDRDVTGVQTCALRSPGGTAIPGQPVTEPEQAPELYPLTKISLISKGGHAPRIRY